MMSKIVFVFSVAIIGSVQSQCNLRNQWGSSCRQPQMIQMTAAMKKALVDIHNQKRNEIALGKIPNYATAANMATMQWDDDLAAKAALNVRQCQMVHDRCAPGQNLAMYKTTGSLQISPEFLANRAGSGWFDKEQINGGSYGWMKMINRLPNTGSPVVGHFTQFVRASANKLGCAVSTSKDGRWNAIWLACNYSDGNMLGTPVYQAGPSASACRTGKNPQYPGLCK